MKSYMSRIALVTAAGVALTSCAPTPENCRLNQTATGMAVGAAAGLGAGALIAAATRSGGATGLAIGLGTGVIGAAIGAAIGQEGDKACHQMAVRQALDLAMAQQQRMEAERQSWMQPSAAASAGSTSAAKRKALAQAAPPPPKFEVVQWQNGSTSNAGSVQPLSISTNAATKQDCADVEDTFVVNGQPQVKTAKFCKMSNGDWQPAS